MSFNTPVLFLIFNRPDVTRQVFQQIRKIRPSKLFVAADGPRRGYANDTAKCREAREVVMKNIDWDCKLTTLFRDENLGCGKGVSSAITWFFENVEEGIILEDDCQPDDNFFHFCEAMLERYRYTEQVMHVGGTNFQQRDVSKYTYYFSNYLHIWGWATWRRAWSTYRFDLQSLDGAAFKNAVESRYTDKHQRRFWVDTFSGMVASNIDTWDLQWIVNVFIHHGVGITPVNNYIQNIGFRPDATHTQAGEPQLRTIFNKPLLPIAHPLRVRVLKSADNFTYKKLFQFGNTRFNRMKFKIGKMFPVVKTLYLKTGLKFR